MRFSLEKLISDLKIVRLSSFGTKQNSLRSLSLRPLVSQSLLNKQIRGKKNYVPKRRINDYMCSICTEYIPVHQRVFTSCGHIFHEQCICTWIQKSRTCPNCRNPFTSREISEMCPNTFIPLQLPKRNSGIDVYNRGPTARTIPWGTEF